MRKILKILIPLVVLGGILYQYRDIIFHAPCKNPIPYTLGTFDAQFGISQNYFLGAVQEAEKIWEKPFGKKLFVYEENNRGSDVLKINLVYDYRQQATGKLASLGIAVADDRTSYNNLKIKFTGLKKEYATALKDYELSKLEATRLKINGIVEEINALVVVLNRLASTLNISVAKYNTVGASRGESFEEGVYSSDGLNSEIDIYEFSNRTKLVRVLAHELGHALGLDHVNDSKAIMYTLNQGNNETLTKADLVALKTKCGMEP